MSLTTATECCHELRRFDLYRSPFVEWIGFKPNPAITTIGDRFPFRFGSKGLTSVDLSPQSNITAVEMGF